MMNFNDENYHIILKGISERIRSLRIKKGLTQQDMEAYGFNYRHFQRIESGKHSISLYTLYRISEVFEVEMNSLL